MQGAIESIALFGSGHINDSYHVRTSDESYLLQKINTSVFRDSEVLEANLTGLFSTDSDILVEHIKTTTGKWLLNSDSGVWKLQVFGEGTFAPTLADDLLLVREVGRGFGKFTALSQHLSIDNFKEAIPNFHSLKWRLNQLDEAVEGDIARRVTKAGHLIDLANKYRWISKRMDELAGQLPLRVCHNDTKIDNVLLAKATNQFKYVIDLDTAGPGYVLYDFGDMMRTLLSPTKESETDQSKIELRHNYFESLKEGFLEECGTMLDPLEIDSLSFGGLYMTYIMAIRFLTDYLNGDQYYKISFEEENYIRSRNQFVLLGYVESLI